MTNYSFGTPNTQKTPEQQVLSANEAPVVRASLNEVDQAAQNLAGASQPYLSRLAVESAAQTAATERVATVSQIADHPRYRHVSSENNPAMAALARQAAWSSQNPSLNPLFQNGQGADDVQKIA